jgi:hypothetical protein
MEPQYSVFLYSKYSSFCKRIFDTFATNNIDTDKLSSIRFHTLCIDNDKIRKRIVENAKIEVESVPCILSIYTNGGVEKYEGGHAFKWVESLVSKIAPPPPPQPMQPPPPPPQPIPTKQPIEDTEPLSRKKSTTKSRIRSRPQPREEIDIPTEDTTGTSIDDLPYEDDSDRHRSVPQPHRIRQDETGYIEDDELFQGEQVDNRREPNGVLRGSASDRKTVDPNGTRAKAEELARGREEIERQINPNKRPLVSRRE